MRTPSPNWVPQPWRHGLYAENAGGVDISFINPTADKILTLEQIDFACTALDPTDNTQVVISFASGTIVGQAPIFAKQLDQDANNQTFGTYRGVIPLLPGDGINVTLFSIAGPNTFNTGVLACGYWTPYLHGLPQP